LSKSGIKGDSAKDYTGETQKMRSDITLLRDKERGNFKNSKTVTTWRKSSDVTHTLMTALMKIWP